jgi:hypothetical protein
MYGLNRPQLLNSMFILLTTIAATSLQRPDEYARMDREIARYAGGKDSAREVEDLSTEKRGVEKAEHIHAEV